VREALERIGLMHACRAMRDDDFDHLHTLLRRRVGRRGRPRRVFIEWMKSCSDTCERRVCAWCHGVRQLRALCA